MTMHRAKGMEFSRVLIFGADADLMPASYLLKSVPEGERDDVSPARAIAVLRRGHASARRARRHVVRRSERVSSNRGPAEVRLQMPRKFRNHLLQPIGSPKPKSAANAMSTA